jgi:hypothetical protein
LAGSGETGLSLAKRSLMTAAANRATTLHSLLNDDADAVPVDRAEAPPKQSGTRRCTTLPLFSLPPLAPPQPTTRFERADTSPVLPVLSVRAPDSDRPSVRQPINVVEDTDLVAVESSKAHFYCYVAPRTPKRTSSKPPSR